MNLEEIRQILREHNQVAFKFSDGYVEIVDHPENALITNRSIGIAKFADGGPDWIKTYAMAHLVSVEPLPSAAGRQPNN